MSNPIKFRIWDRQAKRFAQNDGSLHCQSNWSIDAFSGEIFDFVRAIDGDYGSEVYTRDANPNFYAQGIDIIKDSRFVLSQFTGLRDCKEVEVFEGDIIQFKARPSKIDEKDNYQDQVEVTYIGRVVRDQTTTNLCLEVVEPCGLSFFPLAYAGGSKAEIIGNVHQI